MQTYTVNAAGLACPMPVIQTKKMLESLSDQELEEAVISVIVDNEVANANVTKFAQSVGLTVDSKENGGIYFLTLRKGEAAVFGAEVDLDPASNPDINQSAGVGAPTYFFGTDKLGEDPELGAALMKTFLFTLSESTVLPENLIFLNSGVKLTTSEIPALVALEEKGVRILSCGACLNFFGLEGALKVGSVSNMYEIVEVLNRAPRVI
ncbi:MAG: sulfurtransferase-like selenium metabolism protein YedF, partial [Bacillota bacterium]|nr:sulfurtransferase-like selenium metabolism protein YedF [Bacillota bacterium]